MHIRLLAFASAGDALGAGELDLELPDGSRLADLRALLARDHPALAPLWPRLAVAIDGRLAAPDEALTDGAEVALLPPVSGGSGGTGESGEAPASAAELVDGPLDVDAVVRSVSGPDRGAVVVFLGTVRDRHDGRAVERLTYSAYRPMAEARLRAIAADLAAAAPSVRVAIAHRLGEVPVGEPSVVIAVASPHRAAAYEASRAALERLKTEVPIWKREHYADGEAAWREEEALSAALPRETA
ncbi:MAG TPA: molybdenum cofactor biosynthesis protein MoaE [Thermoanaerobaculia bacterium]|nr:molybdenum cofactor biosynthesis protein MoaE [Thermoanaerobaculia bacterium]